MKLSDILKTSWRDLGKRKLRTALATLGVVIGIAAVIGVLSLSQGFQTTITGQIERGFGLDTLVVLPRGSFEGGRSGLRLLVNDTSTINEVEGVTLATPVVSGQARISHGGNSIGAQVSGVNFQEYATVQSDIFTAETGSIPDDPENDTIVLGYTIAHPPDPDVDTLATVGDEVTLSVVTREGGRVVTENRTFTVEVTLEEVGTIGFTTLDDQVFIPIETAKDLFQTEEAGVILTVIDDISRTQEVSDEISSVFEDQVSVISPRGFIDLAEPIFNTIDLFLGGIAAIALVVAGIGIMNIMIVSVVERTREIGILKALGAESRTILGLFLSEAMVIGILGGILGVSLGVGLASGISQLVNQGFSFGTFQENLGGTGQAPTLNISPAFTPEVLIGSFVFAIVISVVFGLYPAWRASKKEPVEALRYE